MEITVAQVDDLRLKLREMPPQEEAKQKLTLQQAIVRMADELTELQRRGYSIDDIVHILRGTGVEISPKSLKTYLSRLRNTSKPRRKRPSTPYARNARGRARELTGTQAHAQRVDPITPQKQPGAVMPGAAPDAAHQTRPPVITDTSGPVTHAGTPVATGETVAVSSVVDTRCAHGVESRVDGGVDCRVDRGVDSAVDRMKDRPTNQGVDLGRPAQGSASGGAPRDGAGDARQDRTGGPGTAITRDQPQPVARSSSFVPRADSPNI